MSSVINTNVLSLSAQRNLSNSNSALAQSLERLSSGLRINSAKDDAAGLAISERFTTQVRGLNQAVRNANDGISLAQTAEGALQESGNILQRVRELAVQSANATNSASDRLALQSEVNQLLSELDRIANTSSFNGQKLLDGSFTTQGFQIGADAFQTINVNVGAATSDRLGINRVESSNNVSGITNATGDAQLQAVARSDAAVAATFAEALQRTGGIGAQNLSIIPTTGEETKIAVGADDSAGAIANALNNAGIAGLTATASNEVQLDFSQVNSVEVGEKIQFSLFQIDSNGNQTESQVSFFRGEFNGANNLAQDIAAAIDNVGGTINTGAGGTAGPIVPPATKITVDQSDAANGILTLTGDNGATIGVQNWSVTDVVMVDPIAKLTFSENSVAAAETNFKIITHSDMAAGERLDFKMTVGGITREVNFIAVGGTTNNADALETAINTAFSSDFGGTAIASQATNVVTISDVAGFRTNTIKMELIESTLQGDLKISSQTSSGINEAGIDGTVNTWAGGGLGNVGATVTVGGSNNVHFALVDNTAAIHADGAFRAAGTNDTDFNVNLRGVDITDTAAVAAKFAAAIAADGSWDATSDGGNVSVQFTGNNGQTAVFQIQGNGTAQVLAAGTDGTALATQQAGISLTSPQNAEISTTQSQFVFGFTGALDGTGPVGFRATEQNSTFKFGGETVNEAAFGNSGAAQQGTLKIEVDDGTSITSDVTIGNLFGVREGEEATFRDGVADTSGGNNIQQQTLTIAGEGVRDVIINDNDSAKTIAANINAVSDVTGVTARGRTTADVGRLSADGVVSFNLNGTDISASTTTKNFENLVDAINSQSSKTGVTAQLSVNRDAMTLTAETGVDIAIQDFRLDAPGRQANDPVTMDVNGATGGAARLTDVRTLDTDTNTLIPASTTDSTVIGGTVTLKSTAGYFTATSDVGQSAGGLFNGAAGEVQAGDLAKVNTIDISSVKGATAALDILDGALGRVNSLRADLGAIQNRFDSTIANLSVSVENLSASRSRIQDTDFAAQTAELTRVQILRQAGTSVLAQANNAPQSVLALLQ